jgi:hypothetical protein
LGLYERLVDERAALSERSASTERAGDRYEDRGESECRDLYRRLLRERAQEGRRTGKQVAPHCEGVSPPSTPLLNPTNPTKSQRCTTRSLCHLSDLSGYSKSDWSGALSSEGRMKAPQRLVTR